MLVHRAADLAVDPSPPRARPESLVWGRRICPVGRARSVLGYQPRYGFAALLNALELSDPGHCPYSQEPWWGVERPDRG